jgi:hypothetical protein
MMYSCVVNIVCRLLFIFFGAVFSSLTDSLRYGRGGKEAAEKDWRIGANSVQRTSTEAPKQEYD